MRDRIERATLRIPDGWLVLILWVALPLVVTFVGFWIKDGIEEAASVTLLVAAVIACCAVLLALGAALLVGVGSLAERWENRRYRP